MYLAFSYNAVKGDAFMWHVIFKNYCSYRPRGLMDKASDFESEDCEFESRRGRLFCIWSNIDISKIFKLNHYASKFVSQKNLIK